LTGAIVGLGHIGFGFNADRKRKGVWTHEQAFTRAGVRLIGAVDIAAAQRNKFTAKRPEVPAFSSLKELLRSGVPDLVSICTPTFTHAAVARQCVQAGVRAVFCEKPMTSTILEAAALVKLCRQRHIILAVNHTRRWDARYLRAAALIRGEAVGEVRSVSARYSGHIFNIGTHLIDTVCMITGAKPVSAVGFSQHPKAPDPHVSGQVRLDSGVACEISCHGLREDLLFEIDVVGSRGRLRIFENGSATTLERFKPSPNYGGYRELKAARLPNINSGDRFVAAVRDIGAALKNPKHRVSCGAGEGYYALAAAAAMADSARQNSKLKTSPLKTVYMLLFPFFLRVVSCIAIPTPL